MFIVLPRELRYPKNQLHVQIFLNTCLIRPTVTRPPSFSVGETYVAQSCAEIIILCAYWRYQESISRYTRTLQWWMQCYNQKEVGYEMILRSVVQRHFLWLVYASNCLQARQMFDVLNATWKRKVICCW